jgi:hypothetical protein
MGETKTRAVREVPGRSPRARPDIIVEAVSMHGSALGCLERLVGRAKAYFEAGRDPDEAYHGLDIAPLAALLSLDRLAAPASLSAFRDRPGEDRLAACMFISSAVVSVDRSDPHMARLILASISEKARKDPSLAPMARMVFLMIAETAADLEGTGDADASLVSLGELCARRI